LILGLIFSGVIKGSDGGISIPSSAGLLAGVGRLWDPVRILYLAVVLGTTSVAMISFMFCSWSASAIQRCRVAMFGVLIRCCISIFRCHLSGRRISALASLDFYIDPFTYAVHG